MNYSAKSYFSDWYNIGTKREAPTDELQKRRNSIEKILQNESMAFWIDLVKVYFNLHPKESAEYTQLIEYFKNDDEFFSVSNEFLFKLLLGCTLAEKIELQNNLVSDFLALAVLARTPLLRDNALPDLVRVAENTLSKKSKNVRSRENSSAPLKVNAIGITDLISDDDNDSDQRELLNRVAEKLVPLINGLADTLNRTLEENKKLQFAVNNLSEETNILWWMFSGFSNIANKPFKELTSQQICTVIALELQSSTKILPGITNIANIVYAILENSEKDVSAKTIKDIMSDVSNLREPLAPQIPDVTEDIHLLCPFVSGLKYIFKYSQNEWAAYYTKEYPIDLEATTELLSFTDQLYKELMLIKVCKEIKQNGQQ